VVVCVLILTEAQLGLLLGVSVWGGLGVGSPPLFEKIFKNKSAFLRV